MNSRSKGCRGELEWSKRLHDLGFPEARRGQQFAGGVESPDVVSGIPGTHAEVKRVERLNIEAAMQQAEDDCMGSAFGLPVRTAIPYVAHRRNRTNWLVTLRAADLLEFCRRVLASQEQPKEATK